MHRVRLSSKACLPKKTEKTWGGTCEKWDLRGQQSAPSPTEKVGPWPHRQQNMPTKSQKGGVQSPRPRLGIPLGVTPPRGWVRLPSPTSVRLPTRASRKSVAAERKGEKEKQGRRRTRKPLPPRVPRKGPRKGRANKLKPHKFKENPKTARGPEWHPGKTPRSGTHGQNGQNRQKRRDTKKKKNQKTSACEGVSCYYLTYLLKKKQRKTTREERTNPEKTRPDMKRIFPNSFGSETPKNKAKTLAKTHQKTQDQHNHPKTKVRSRKFFQKTTLRGEERQKNDKRHRTRHKKHKMKKMDSISPLGEQTFKSRHSVTVRLPYAHFPHPLPGLSFTAFCRKGVGGG